MRVAVIPVYGPIVFIDTDDPISLLASYGRSHSCVFPMGIEDNRDEWAAMIVSARLEEDVNVRASALPRGGDVHPPVHGLALIVGAPMGRSGYQSIPPGWEQRLRELDDRVHAPRSPRDDYLAEEGSS